MPLSNAIDAYMTLRRAKYAKSTVRCDAQDLRRLLAAVGNVRVKDLTKDMFVAYFYGAKGRVNAVQASTFNAERARIASFLNWAVDEGLIAASPMRGVDRRRVGTRERLRLTSEQMVDAIEGEAYPRDRALLAVVCNTALRAHAITPLTIGGVDLENGYIDTYTSKTLKQVLLPITLELDRELRLYLKWYQEQVGPLRPEWFLLPARHRYGWYNDPVTGRRDDDVSVLRPDQQMCYQTSLRIVHSTLKRLGVDRPGEGLHTLRRSSARAVFEVGVAEGDVRAIHVAREFLGHVNVAQTEAYIGTTDERRVLEGRMRGRSFLSRKVVPDSGVVVSLDAARKRNRGN